MKSINYLPLAIAALALNSGSIALGQLPEISGPLEHRLTVALTVAEEVQNEAKEGAKKTIYSSEIVRSRISNKAFLEFFVDRGEIEEIRGWSIVGLSYNGKGNFNGNVYLVRTVEDAKEYIDVSDYFDITRSRTSVESSREEENNESGDIEGKYNRFQVASFDFVNDDDMDNYIEILLDAVANERGTYEQISDYSSSTMITLDFERGIGEFYDEQGETSGIVRGSYRFGRGVESDLENFFN